MSSMLQVPTGPGENCCSAYMLLLTSHLIPMNLTFVTQLDGYDDDYATLVSPSFRVSSFHSIPLIIIPLQKIPPFLSLSLQFSLDDSSLTTSDNRQQAATF